MTRYGHDSMILSLPESAVKDLWEAESEDFGRSRWNKSKYPVDPNKVRRLKNTYLDWTEQREIKNQADLAMAGSVFSILRIGWQVVG